MYKQISWRRLAVLAGSALVVGLFGAGFASAGLAANIRRWI